MPLPQKWNRKRKKPPAGFEDVEGVLEALENELRDVVKDSNESLRKTEAMWPIHQINWQKSRYIYDLYYVYQRISRAVYQYCLDQKLVDAALIAKWKKPGYERLCSTYVINSANYKFGTVSICRVPWKDRSVEQQTTGIRDPVTGCLGCATSNVKQGGPKNIFGNKYGQHLAAVQMAREERQRIQAEKKQKAVAAAQQQQQATVAATKKEEADDDDSGNEETDDDDETDDDSDDDDDYGPSPAAGIWAGSQKLEQESEKMTYNDDGEEEEDNVGPAPPPAKKVRTDDNEG